MGRHSTSSRRRSSTPNLKLSSAHVSALQTADPASPPDTPITSPQFPRKNAQAALYLFTNALAQDPNIRPYGSGHQFSYRPLEQLSPRSSSSSEADEDASDDESSDSASVVSVPNSSRPPQPILTEVKSFEPHQLDAFTDADADADADAEPDLDSASSGSESESEAEPDKPKRTGSVHGPAKSTHDNCGFTIEDVDPMDSECDGLDVLYPIEIESDTESTPSRSTSQHRDLDKEMIQDLENLNCSNEATDNEAEPEEEEEDDAESEFMRRQQELKRIRRVSMSSSFGKRTHSELSDSDDNDCALDVNEAGSSARRFHKRVHRGSLLFQDPPAPRIDELEEPNSSEDEYAKEIRIVRSLPYPPAEIMDTDSN